MTAGKMIGATFLLAVLSTSTWAKGKTLKIEIAGDGLAAPVVITDRGLLDEFDVWNAQFIDWGTPQAQDPPNGLQRVEVTFFVEAPVPEGATRYVVAYEIDPAASDGYIYIPMWNGLIVRDVAGSWVPASDRWNELMTPLIAAEPKAMPPPADRGALSCIVGPAKLLDDGTITFRYLDEHGNKTSRWRYEPTSEPYERVRALVGDVEPGEPFDLSCWPARS